MIINEYFLAQYLTCGCTYDNHIFEGCPIKFIDIAREALSKDANGVKSCCVTLTSEEEGLVAKTLSNASESLHRKMLAQDFVTAKIMESVLCKRENNGLNYKVCKEWLSAFYKNEFYKVKDMHMTYMPSDVAEEMKNIGKIELNIFLEDTQSVELQQAINLFVSSREPYSVKIFTTNEYLPTYYDQMGNLIQSPHDYIRMDVSKFIKNLDTEMGE